MAQACQTGRHKYYSEVSKDVRICFIGDSFTAGVGDPEGVGWAGRLAAATRRKVGDLTTYNLGIRFNTGPDLQARFESEISRRIWDGADNRVVVCFGVNDTNIVNGHRRVELVRSLAALADIITWCRSRDLPLFVIGPPGIVDDAHNVRIFELSEAMQALAKKHGVPFVPVAVALGGNAQWRSEIAMNDGAHPRAGGYDRFASLVLDGGWLDWIANARR